MRLPRFLLPLVVFTALTAAGGFVVFTTDHSSVRTPSGGKPSPGAPAPSTPPVRIQPAGAPQTTNAAKDPLDFATRGLEWDSADPAKLLTELGKIADAAGRGAFLRGLFERLATSDARAGVRLAVELPAGRERDLALATLLDTLSGTPGLSLASTNPQTGGLAGALGRWLATSDRSDPDLAATVARKFLTGAPRADLLGAAAGAKAASSPREAFLLGESLSGGDQDRFINAFARGWAADDPRAAADWALEIEDVIFRDQVLTGVIAAAAESNAATAAALLPDLAPAGIRQQSIQAIARQWAGQDTQGAFAWARSLPVVSESQTATSVIKEVAPVGVGVSLAAGDEPYPRVAEVVPGGPAARTGALETNDRIVAFTDASGNWIDTSGMKLDQIVGQIRGQAGTGIQLRLLGANDVDPGQARTVAITREQILLKN